MFLRLHPLKTCLHRVLVTDLNALTAKYFGNSSYCSFRNDNPLDGNQTHRRMDQTIDGLKPKWSDAKASHDTDGINRFLSDPVFRSELLQSVFVLSQNVVKGKRPVNQLIASQDLNILCQTIDNNVKYLRNRELINSLHSFLVMSFDPNSSLVQNMENEVLWRAKEMPLKDLLACLSYHVRYQQTDQQKKVVNEMIVNLVIKLDTAEDDDDVIQMLSLWRSLSPEVIEAIENIVIEMIGRSDENQFKLSHLSYILVILSQMNRRTKPLIEAIVNRFTYLSIDPEDYKERHLIHMVSAVNQLKYFDINFLKKASDLLCNQKFLNNIAPSDRRDLLVAISQLNWSYPRLVNEYIEKITDTYNNFSSQDFLVFVSSIARLYVRNNSMTEVLVDYVLPYVKREDLDPDSWLLYVWSLSILGCVPINYVKSVMNNEFYNQLMKNTDSQTNNTLNYKQIMHKMKLLNIKGVAEIEMNETIDFEPIIGKTHDTIKREVSVEKFKKNIYQLLAPFEPNIKTNVLTPYGFAIDAEFIINKDFDILSLEKYGLLSGDPTNKVPELPEGFKRCALMCYGFNDTLLDESGLIGTHELTNRLLRRLGYNVIAINQNAVHLVRGVHSYERLKAFITQSFD